ncbi:heat shock transcription factor, Y-linked-like [Tachyglossus aculeatus]|uniref:heat shock transcription factor, Y-linked-like n=1 Tax=Tachyglossus aculeatus TaxID=9261 RepID=UPI0018F7856B|nr:heat shock transcription factor, Y-linked-like [Tachyglossus aculeatus]
MDEFELDSLSSENRDTSPQARTTDLETCGSSKLSPECNQTSAGDCDLTSVIEENVFQPLAEGPLAKKRRYTWTDDESDNNDFFSFTFPKKLWKITESDQFQSIWWNNDGNCIVIDEELFKKEVLESKGPFRIFETDCMKSFIRQLNLYGFSKIRYEFQRSASLADFLAEEKEVSAMNKLQFYHNPNFKRGCPHLLVRMKRRVGIKNASPVYFSFVQECPRTTENPNGQNIASPIEAIEKNMFFASPNEDGQKSVKFALRRQISATPPVSGFSALPATSVRPLEITVSEQNATHKQLAPIHLPQQSCHAQANAREIDATATSAASLYRVVPPVRNSPFGPTMGLPTFPTAYPELASLQAHLASLLPFCNPWLSMHMLAAASAISMSRAPSRHHQTPSNYHCPNCSCSASNVPTPPTEGPPSSGQ